MSVRDIYRIFFHSLGGFFFCVGIISTDASDAILIGSLLNAFPLIVSKDMKPERIGVIASYYTIASLLIGHLLGNLLSLLSTAIFNVI